MRIRALSACCIAALALAGVAAGATTTVSTNLTPRAILFGDTVLAEVDVTIDTRVDDPSTLNLTPALGAWSIVNPATSTVSRAGPLLRRMYVFTIACRTASCVPVGARRALTLPAALVTVRTRAGKTVRLRESWPSVVEASRLPAGVATAAKPPFLLQTTPPPLHPRVSAKLAADALDAGAVLIALGAVAILLLELRRRFVRVPPPVPDIERALRLVREAEGRPAPDRRKALALLARVVPANDAAELGADAARAAWERESPSPETLGELRKSRDGGRVSATLPLADARSLRRQAAWTRGARLGLAGLLVVAVAVVGLGSRHPSTTAHPYLPAGSNGVVVLDLSASISTDTFSQIGDALQRLSVSGGRYGLVIFSGSAYEALPPGTPAREFASLVPYFTLRPGHDGFAATFPLDPWTQDFSAGTSISSGLNLARSIIARDAIDHPSVLLISDLDDDPGDLRRVASSALALRRAHIPVHVVALSASTSDEQLFGRLFASGGAVEAAPSVGTRAATQHAATPVLLVVATIAVALLLAAAELVFPPLEFRRGAAA